MGLEMQSKLKIHQTSHQDTICLSEIRSKTGKTDTQDLIAEFT